MKEFFLILDVVLKMVGGNYPIDDNWDVEVDKGKRGYYIQVEYHTKF